MLRRRVAVGGGTATQAPAAAAATKDVPLTAETIWKVPSAKASAKGGGAATQAPATAAATRDVSLTAETIWKVPSAKASAKADADAAPRPAADEGAGEEAEEDEEDREAAEEGEEREEEPALSTARPGLSPWAEEALMRRRCAKLTESVQLTPSDELLCAALSDICTMGRCDAIAVEYLPSGRRQQVELARPEEMSGLEPEAVMALMLALARGDDTSTTSGEQLFGVRIPKSPEGEHGKLWLGTVWLDISALGSEAAMVGVPAAKLVKWLAAAPPEADESPGLLYYALCLLACGTLAASFYCGWAACAAMWGSGGAGVASDGLPLEQLRKRLESIAAPKDSQLFQDYHDYYMAEYHEQVSQAAMVPSSDGGFRTLLSSPTALWIMCLVLFVSYSALAAKLHSAVGHGIFWNTGALVFRRIFGLDESLSLARPALGSAGHRVQAAAAAAGEPLAALGVAAPAAPAKLLGPGGGGAAAAAAVPGQLRGLLPSQHARKAPDQAGGAELPLFLAEGAQGGGPAVANPVLVRPAVDAERRPPQLRIDYAASPQKQKLQRKMAARERNQLKGAAGGAATGAAGGEAPCEDPLMDDNAVEALLRELEDIPKLSKKRRQQQQQPRPAAQPQPAQPEPAQGCDAGRRGGQEPPERRDEAAPRAEAAAAPPPSPQPPPQAAIPEAKSGPARGKAKQRAQPAAKDAPSPAAKPPPPQPTEPETPQQAARRAPTRQSPAAGAPTTGQRRPKAPSKDEKFELKQHGAAEKSATAGGEERAATAAEGGAAAADVAAAAGRSAERAAEDAAEARSPEDAGGTWDTAASRSARRRTRKAGDAGVASPATPSAPAAPASPGPPERGRRASVASTASGDAAVAGAAGLPGQGPSGAAATEAADAPGVGAATAAAADRQPTAAAACAAGSVATTGAVALAASSFGTAGEATGDILKDLTLMRSDDLVHWFRANGAEDWLMVQLNGAQSLADVSKEALLGHATQLLGLAGDTERRSTAADPAVDPAEHAICFGDFDGRADDTPASGGGAAEVATTLQEAYSGAPRQEGARREWDPAGLDPEPPEGTVAQAPPAWAGGGGAVAATGQQMGFVSMMPAVQMPGAQAGMFASGQRQYMPMVWMPAQYAIQQDGTAAAGGATALQGLQMVHAAGLPPGATIFAAAGVPPVAAGAQVAGAPDVDAAAAAGAGAP